MTIKNMKPPPPKKKPLNKTEVRKLNIFKLLKYMFPPTDQLGRGEREGTLNVCMHICVCVCMCVSTCRFDTKKMSSADRQVNTC